MTIYEYRILPSPRRAKRAKGARTPQDRYARTLTDMINAEAAEGWEYLRADTLPVDEKKGMLSTATEVYQTVLVFRRPVEPAWEAAERKPEPRAKPMPVTDPEEPTLSRPSETRGEPSMRLGPSIDD